MDSKRTARSATAPTYLLEDHIAKYEQKISRRWRRAGASSAGSSTRPQFLAFTNPNVKRSQDRIDAVEARMEALDANDLAAVRQLMLDEGITCPVSGTANWTEVRQFNLMFATGWAA